MAKFCTNCGNPLEGEKNNCLNCGAGIKQNEKSNENTNNVTSGTQKNKIVAGLLALILGSFGAHNFYLGYTTKGLAQLLITVLSCFYLSGISGLWAFVEGIMILTGSIDKDANGNKLAD